MIITFISDFQSIDYIENESVAGGTAPRFNLVLETPIIIHWCFHSYAWSLSFAIYYIDWKSILGIVFNLKTGSAFNLKIGNVPTSGLEMVSI